jgi:hypothetical protein
MAKQPTYIIKKHKASYDILQVVHGSLGELRQDTRHLPRENLFPLCDILAEKCVKPVVVVAKAEILSRLGMSLLHDSMGIKFSSTGIYSPQEVYQSLLQGGVFRQYLWSLYYWPLKILEDAKCVHEDRDYVYVHPKEFGKFYRR